MDALRMWRDLARKEKPPPREAVDLYRRAIQSGFNGDWAEAEALLEDSLEPLEAAGAPEAAAANHNLAVIHFERGDGDGAVFHCIRGLFLYNRAQDIGGLYAALRNLAVIHKSRGEESLAVAAAREAARARGELTARGLLEAAESGCDSQGEPLKILAAPLDGVSHLEAV